MPVLDRFESEGREDPAEPHMKTAHRKFNGAHILPTGRQHRRDEGEMIPPGSTCDLRQQVPDNSFVDSRPLPTCFGSVQHFWGNLVGQAFPRTSQERVRLFSSHAYPSPASP